MGKHVKLLSRQEEIVLLAIWRLGNEANGVSIREFISQKTEKYWSIGSIYVPLDRLLEKEFIEFYHKDIINKKGGRRKRFYKITDQGMEALEELSQLQGSLWKGFPGFAID